MVRELSFMRPASFTLKMIIHIGHHYTTCFAKNLVAGVHAANGVKIDCYITKRELRVEEIFVDWIREAQTLFFLGKTGGLVDGNAQVIVLPQRKMGIPR